MTPMLAHIFIGIVALLHFFFLYLEMFLWTTPSGRKRFGTTEQQAKDTAVLAANQGLYNGFLGAGLIWSLLHSNPQTSHELAVFFLACVIVAAIYGGATSNKKILVVQGLPALVALALVLFS